MGSTTKTSACYVIRQARSDDVESLVAIDRVANAIWPHREADMARQVEDGRALFLVVEQPDPWPRAPVWSRLASRPQACVLGYLLGRSRTDAVDRMASIHDVVVAAQSRRAGVGRALVQTALAHWGSDGVGVVCVVPTSPVAAEFFRAMGFRPDGPGWYRHLQD